MALSEEVPFFAAYAAVKLFFCFLPMEFYLRRLMPPFACFLPFTGGPFAVAYAAISVFACFLPFPGGPSAAIFFRAAP